VSRAPLVYRLLNALRAAVEDWAAGDTLTIEQMKAVWRQRA